jgi:hypothetical protein
MEGRREDLDHLVHSPGWARFMAHIEHEWGTKERGGGIRFTQGAHKAADILADAEAANQLRQICIAQREIHNLVSWVYTELKQSTKDEQQLATAGAPDYSRRGGL